MDQENIILYSLGSLAQISDTITQLEGDAFNVIRGNRHNATSPAISHLGNIILFQDRFPANEPEYSKILTASRKQGKIIVYHPGKIQLGKPETYPKAEAHQTMMAVLQAMMDADLVICTDANQRDLLSGYNTRVVEPSFLRNNLPDSNIKKSANAIDWLSGNLGRVLLDIRSTLIPPNTLAERLWLMPGRAWYVYVSEGWAGVLRQLRAKFPGSSIHMRTPSRGKPLNIPVEPVSKQSKKHTYSIIVLTHNNLNYTRLCLESIFTHTKDVECEIIILDNASTDDTPDYLTELAQVHPNLKVILSDVNLGFAGGNNLALKESKGDILVLLNNDTVVTQGWLQKLTAPLVYPEIGIIGPITNSSPYENGIEVPYRDLEEMHQFAAETINQLKQQWYQVPMLIFFCVAFRRQVYEQVGELDVDFRIGLFEDEDYSRRVREAGYKIVYTPDAFVHHWGSVTMSKMGDRGFWKLYHENRKRFEQKWQPHPKH